MADPLLRFRDDFPILAKTNYLISNSLGAMPMAAAEGLARYADGVDLDAQNVPNRFLWAYANPDRQQACSNRCEAL